MKEAAYGNYPNLNGVKKILVVKLRHLGDVLLTAPVFSALKKALPDARIDAFIWSESAPMLDGHPDVGQLLQYDRSWKKLGVRKWFKEACLFWRIRKEKYDVVINLTEGDRGALAARFSGARIRVGFDPKGKGFWGKRGLYTHIVKHCPGLRHTVERNLDAVRRMGIFPRLEERRLFIHVPQESLKAAERVTGQKPFVLIHPSSRWRFKCWPSESMRELARRFLERGERLIFTSGPDPIEMRMVEEIARDLDVLNLGGKISLKELSALIQKANALICVDSVPLHLASALKTPVIALFGPTSDVTWGPWQHKKARVVTSPMSCRPCYQDGCGGSKVSDCLHQISVSQVLAAYDTLMKPIECEELCLKS